MTTILITLVDSNQASFELELEYNLIANAQVISYRGDFYMYKASSKNVMKPKFIQINKPVFVG